jgi:hypothetical protein
MPDDLTPTLTVTIDADTRPLEAQLAEVSKAGARFSNALSQSFVDLALKGRSFGDVLRSLALRLSELALKAAFKPLTDSIGNALAGLVGGAAFARGGVIRQGLPVPFAPHRLPARRQPPGAGRRTRPRGHPAPRPRLRWPPRRPRRRRRGHRRHRQYQHP